MKKKCFYVCGVLLIGIAVCVSVWFFLQEHNRQQLQGHSHHISSRQHKGGTTKNRNSPQQEQTLDEARIEKLRSQIKSQIMSMHTEEQLADPDRQKRLAVFDSPEFLEFMKDSHPTGLDQRKLNDFWESQGFPVKRNYLEMFHKVFPSGEPEDYDSEMRLKIAKMFLASDPVDLTDPEAAFRQRRKIISKLMAKDNTDPVWYLGRFGEEWDGPLRLAREGARGNAAREWMIDVQRSAASIVANAEAAGSPGSDTDTSASSWDLSSVMESPPVSSDATTEESPSASPPAIDALARPAIPNPETKAAVTPVPGLTDVPKTPTNLPTVEGLETSLKEQFSSERFDRAMSTLEQYGPEEGLRRLKESDPEVAEQVERHRNRKETSK